MRIPWILFLCVFSLPLGAIGAPPDSLEVLARDEGPPFNYMENGNAVGLAIDVVKLIQKRMKTKEEVLIVPWARGYQTLKIKSNTALFTVARTKDREKLFSMIGPIGVAPVVFYAKKGSLLRIHSLEDAKKVLRIAVRGETIFESLLLQKGFTNLLVTKTVEQNLDLLAAQRVDLFCDSRIEVEGSLKILKRDPKQLHQVFDVANLDLYIAFSRGTPTSTIAAWKRELQALKDDGSFKKIYEKWLPGEKPPMGVHESMVLINP